nr:external alternative NAD(P)H-ubiquinone oxidoreductase B1, mitochondrial-like [Tanacetum cinerariifolium]
MVNSNSFLEEKWRGRNKHKAHKQHLLLMNVTVVIWKWQHRCNYTSDLCSGNKIDKLVSDKERGSIAIRSKYFKKQDGGESELQLALVSSTKLICISDKRMSTLLNNPAHAKRGDISFTEETSTLIRNTTSSENALKKTTSRYKHFGQFGPLGGEQAAAELPGDWVSMGRNTQWLCTYFRKIGGFEGVLLVSCVRWWRVVCGEYMDVHRQIAVVEKQ